MVIFEIKVTVFICLLSSEGCDNFPKHLDFALAPNKTNDAVKKQTILDIMINCGALSLTKRYSEYAHFYWCVGDWGKTEGGSEDLDSCLALLVF